MSNWGTMVQEVKDDLGGGYTTAGDKIKKSIVDAIEKHRADRFWFNKVRFTFATVASQAVYTSADSGFPDGLIDVLDNSLTVELDQDDDSDYFITKKTVRELDAFKVGTSDLTANPTYFAVVGEDIEIWPTPDAVHNVKGVAHVDQWTLGKSYSAGWSFTKPDGTAITDSYPSGGAETNPWFTEAYQMIRHYAVYLLLSGVLHNKDGADSKALQRYLEFRSALEDRSDRLERVSFPRPYQFAGY